MKKNCSGFTFLEMSIVILVIALIVGAVMVGQTLIASAKLQSVIADVNQFKNALKLFKEKYGEFPGDFSNAQSFWGTDAGCPGPAANVLPKVATCNGNGNGAIGDVSANPLNIANVNESLHAWQHLANAGLIEGRYTGAVSSTANAYYEPGVNLPKSKWAENASFTLANAQPGSTGLSYEARYNNIIVFGQVRGIDTASNAYMPALKGHEAREIDEKTDDGMPGMGNVLSYPPGLAMTSLCASSASSTAAYRLDRRNNTCSLIFITGM